MNRIPRLLTAGRIIAKPIPPKDEQVGKMIIPKTANATLSEAEIIKFDRALKPLMKEGDIAVYPTGTGLGYLVGGEPYIFLNIHEIWAIDEPEQAQIADKVSE